MTDQVLAAQLPPRRSPPSHGIEALKARFEDDRNLMLLAEYECEIVGSALALRTGDAVKVDVIAVMPGWRRLGIGRRLMEAIEVEALRLGARSIYLGGATNENRAFYRRLGLAGRKSLMQKALPVSGRLVAARVREQRQ